MEKRKTYIAIDLKSFYASVECVERGLDPLTTNLVVADASRTEKTICLAVSPALKAYGIPGRARLFEVVQKVQQVNAMRQMQVPGGQLTGKSTNTYLLQKHRDWALDYIVAPPQMAHYMEVSSAIYAVYLQYVSVEDIHVYSIDEVFIDATPYLKTYGLDGRGFAEKLIRAVMDRTGITATAGIGTNLYLCKVAMDIVAKHVPPDEHGVRIAELDEMSYRRLLWNHKPLTDFWRVGRGTARRLEKCGIHTMGEIARCSLGGPNEFYNEDLLYRMFGVAAELLIDHAWGYEPCTIAAIRSYKPETNSVSSGQVLSHPYPWDKARLIVREMSELMALDLVEKGLVTDQVGLMLGYDVENLTNPALRESYNGAVVTDYYGRSVPKHSAGTINLPRKTSSSRIISDSLVELFDRIADPNLLVRRVNISANQLISAEDAAQLVQFDQMDLFADTSAQKEQDAVLERENRRQKAMLHIKQRFGKNAILRGMNLEEGATTIERNGQVGGHKA